MLRAICSMLFYVACCASHVARCISFVRRRACLQQSSRSSPRISGHPIRVWQPEAPRARAPSHAHNAHLTDLLSATSAPGLGSPCHICTGTGLPLPHLHQDWPRHCRICTGTGLRTCHICPWTGLVAATAKQQCVSAHSLQLEKWPTLSFVLPGRPGSGARAPTSGGPMMKRSGRATNQIPLMKQGY